MVIILAALVIIQTTLFHQSMPSGGDPTLEVALMPTRYGYQRNTGPIPVFDLSPSDDQVQVALDLSSVTLINGVRSQARLIVRNGINAPPFAFDGRGNQDWTKIGLVLHNQQGVLLEKSYAKPPNYQSTLDSATLPNWRLRGGEYIVFPISLVVVAPSGSYTVRPFVETPKSEEDHSAYYNKNDWHGKAIGAPTRIEVVERRRAAELTAQFSAAKVTPNLADTAKSQGKFPITCVVRTTTSDQLVAAKPNETISVRIVLTAWDDECLPFYSPVNWQRSLAGMDFRISWTKQGQVNPFAVIAVADPPELAPAIGSLPPIDQLKAGQSIELPLEVIVPSLPGEYSLGCGITLDNCTPHGKAYRVQAGADCLDVKVVKE